jgi:hypothetical protein
VSRITARTGALGFYRVTATTRAELTELAQRIAQRCAQRIATWRSLGVRTSSFASAAPPLTRLARVTSARCALFGANTRW